ncbi:hypothetical protein SAMN05216364_101521 [Porphyromonadaceae bacterium KHP3R9]|nr:hypothetical protein SAMN05216364_101521 [Porphyromonadaceae bacterium KHP3R9]
MFTLFRMKLNNRHKKTAQFYKKRAVYHVIICGTRLSISSYSEGTGGSGRVSGTSFSLCGFSSLL